MRCPIYPAVPREIFTPPALWNEVVVDIPSGCNAFSFLLHWGLFSYISLGPAPLNFSQKTSRVYPVGSGNRTGADLTGARPVEPGTLCLPCPPCEINDSQSEVYFTGVAPADGTWGCSTGVKLSQHLFNRGVFHWGRSGRSYWGGIYFVVIPSGHSIFHWGGFNWGLHC